MARIVAIMFFLCKLFFDLPGMGTKFLNPAFWYIDDLGSNRSDNMIPQCRIALE
jgi:hypothetical protein